MALSLDGSALEGVKFLELSEALAAPIFAASLDDYERRMMPIVEELPAWLFCAFWLLAIPAGFRRVKWLRLEDSATIKQHLFKDQNSYGLGKHDP